MLTPKGPGGQEHHVEDGCSQSPFLPPFLTEPCPRGALGTSHGQAVSGRGAGRTGPGGEEGAFRGWQKPTKDILYQAQRSKSSVTSPPPSSRKRGRFCGPLPSGHPGLLPVPRAGSVLVMYSQTWSLRGFEVTLMPARKFEVSRAAALLKVTTARLGTTVISGCPEQEPAHTSSSHRGLIKPQRSPSEPGCGGV